MPKKLQLTEEAAAELARRVSTATERYSQEYAPRCDVVPAVDIRPACLRSEWTRNEVGLWVAKACFIIDDAGRLDTSFLFDVCCPQAYRKPSGSKDSWRFLAIWRGRGEALQTNIESPTYEGARGIAIYPSSDSYLVENTGVVESQIPGQSYADSGTLYFCRNHFAWVSSSLDVVGKKEIALKTVKKRVVTDVVNGVPQYEYLTVLDC